MIPSERKRRFQPQGKTRGQKMPKPKLNDTANSYTHKSTRKVTLEPKSRGAKAHRQAADLTGLQERAAELCSDLILRGGHEGDVRLLLQAIISHECRRRFPGANKDGGTLHQEMANEWGPDWYTELARAWPACHAAADDTPASTTINEMILSNVKQLLRDSFENFINSAEGFGDAQLLKNVLADWETGDRSLGEAFALQLSSSNTYLKVPLKFQKIVETLLKVLEQEDTQ